MPERSFFNEVPSLTQLTALRLARYRLSDPKGYEAAEKGLSDAAKAQVETLYPWVQAKTYSWFARHEKFLPMHARLEAYLNALQWSSSGIDAQATAKVLLQDSRLRALHRYGLACLHGLEPETIQALLIEAETENAWYWSNLGRIRSGEEDLVIFWAYQCSGRLPELIAQWARRASNPTAYTQRTEAWHGMACAVTALSLGAIRYFYPLITAAEREQYQARWALGAAQGRMGSGGHPELVVFFLERMTAEERRALIERDFKTPSLKHSDVLASLMDWLYRGVFFGLYEEVVQELSPDNIAGLLFHAVSQGRDFFLTLWQHPATVSRRVVLPKCPDYSYTIKELLNKARFSELAMVLEATTIESYRDWLNHRKGMNTYLGLVDHVAGKGAAAIEPLLEQLIRRGLPERTLTHLQALLAHYESMIGGDPSWPKREQLVQLRSLLENTLLRLTASRPDPEVASTASSQASSQASQRKEDVAADPIEEPPIKLMKR